MRDFGSAHCYAVKLLEGLEYYQEISFDYEPSLRLYKVYRASKSLWFDFDDILRESRNYFQYRYSAINSSTCL